MDHESPYIYNMFLNEKDIDKLKYKEIVKKVFGMFQDPNTNIKKVWNDLIELSIYYASKSAKDALEELVMGEEKPLYIIRYKNLLADINEIEFIRSKELQDLKGK